MSVHITLIDADSIHVRFVLCILVNITKRVALKLQALWYADVQIIFANSFIANDVKPPTVA